MLQVTKFLPQGQGLAAGLVKRAATIELPWVVRQNCRFEASDSHARRLAVLLPAGTVLRGNDVLVAEDGSMVRVVAAPQPVMVIRHVGDRGTLFDLVRAAYHLGQRHVALELAPDHLKIEPDPLLADLLRAMHLVVHETLAPFEPEATPGTHAGHVHGNHGTHVHKHGHDHEHDTQVHDHEHDQREPGDHGSIGRS